MRGEGIALIENGHNGNMAYEIHLIDFLISERSIKNVTGKRKEDSPIHFYREDFYAKMHRLVYQKIYDAI